MPMRAEMRKFYGPTWRRRRAHALMLRGHMRCDKCGQPHHMINWAHLAGDPRVKGEMGWLCPHCHGVHDTPYRIAMTRRTQARKRGQLWLSAEIEFAPLPVKMWPDELRQIPLFGDTNDA